MSLRSTTLYVEPKTVRRLILVTKMYPERVGVGDTGGMATREKSADERADALLNEAIKEKYPHVVRLEQKLAETERDFIKAIQNEKDLSGKISDRAAT